MKSLALPLAACLLGALVSGARTSLLFLEPEDMSREESKGSSWVRRASGLLDRERRGAHWAQTTLDLLLLMGTVGCMGSHGLDDSVKPFLLLAFFSGYLLMAEVLPECLLGPKTPRKWVPLLVWVGQVAAWVAFPWTKLEAFFRGTRAKEESIEDGIPLSWSVREEIAWKIRSPEVSPDHLGEQRRMIDRILKLSEVKVREIMIPLIEVCAVEERTPVGKVVEVINEEGYSRIPVYRERIDQVVGMVRAKDLLGVSDLSEPASNHLLPVPFVPESMPVDELLLKLKSQGQHLAMVVDEYGGAVGLVTMEDLIEEIIGEIQDEYDVEEPQFKWLASHQVLVSARTEIEDLNEKLGFAVPKGDYETLGGFLLDAFRRIPSKGDSLVLGEVRFTVHRVSDRTIEEVMITLPRKEKAG